MIYVDGNFRKRPSVRYAMECIVPGIRAKSLRLRPPPVSHMTGMHFKKETP